MTDLTQILPDTLEYDLTQIRVPLKIGSDKHWLTEASEAAVIAYRNAGISGVHLNDEGKPNRITDVGSSDSVLLSKCLYMAMPDGSFPEKGGEPNVANLVSVERIRSLPARVSKPLIEKCKEISNLDRDESREEVVKQIARLQSRLEKIDAKDQTLKNS